MSDWFAVVRTRGVAWDESLSLREQALWDPHADYMDGVEAALLPRLIGWGKTRRLLMTGETLDADRAFAWGLVEEVAPPGGLDAAVEAVVADILACGPHAVRAQKALIDAWEHLPLDQAVEAGIEAFGDAYRTDEPRRMMGAFLQAQADRKAKR